MTICGRRRERRGNRQSALHVVSYASPPEKYFPGNDGSGNTHCSVHVILNVRFPRFLPEGGDNGNRQSHMDVILNVRFPRFLPESGSQWE
jgi:hypothetical protein